MVAYNNYDYVTFILRFSICNIKKTKNWSKITQKQENKDTKKVKKKDNLKIGRQNLHKKF